MLIVAEDVPKFLVLDERTVLATTGRKDICDDVDCMAKQLIAAKGPVSGRFDPFVNELTRIIQKAFLTYSDQGPHLRFSAALVAADDSAQRLRTVGWTDATGLAPLEDAGDRLQLYAYGHDGQPAVDKLQRVLLTLVPLDEISITHAMRQVISDCAVSCPGINDRCFFHTIRL
ncbi:MAG: hypothetical protein WEA80_04950 [Gemmatimonadaceae bacterium]